MSGAESNINGKTNTKSHRLDGTCADERGSEHGTSRDEPAFVHSGSNQLGNDPDDAGDSCAAGTENEHSSDTQRTWVHKRKVSFKDPSGCLDDRPDVQQEEDDWDPNMMAGSQANCDWDIE